MPTPEAKLTSKELLQRTTGKTPERVWHDALGFLQVELPRQFFDTWVRDAEPVSFDGNSLILSVANEFALEKLKNDYKETIHRALSMVMGHAVDVQIVVTHGVDTDHDSPDRERVEDGHIRPLLNSGDHEDIPDEDQRLEIMLQFRRHWEKIVDPEKVVSISRYFVKYWLPILGPDFASAVLAFKQLRFLHNAETKEPFQVYVSELLQWQGVSKSTFYRRLENQHPLLSWFVEEAPNVGVDYEQPAPGQIRQKPKKYIVYGGTPLSPPHQIAVRKLLLETGANKDLDETISALETSLKVSNSDLRKLLDESFSDYMEKGNDTHPQQALTVLDIALEILIIHDGDPRIGRISILAEKLENKLIRPDQVINLSWYFVREWQLLLKSSAFWLIVLLRSMGFYDKRTSELRNTFWIDGGFSELGEKIGVSSETISGWFGGNRKSQNSAQSEYMSHFVQEIERTRGRNGNNHRSISVKLAVEMIDPLTPKGELQFSNFIQVDGDDFSQLFRQPINHYPEIQDSSEMHSVDSPEIRNSRASNSPEFWDSTSDDIPEKWDSRKTNSPEIRDSRTPDSTEFWDSIKDSINTLSTQITKHKNTLENTTTHNVNQLLLPLIYSSESVKNKDPGRRSSKWNLEDLLRVNTISPGQIRNLLGLGIKGQDFAAWILYAYSQEGRGIEKPGFFAAKRLLEVPPVLAQERWKSLAVSGPEFVRENIHHALDPLERDVDRGWGNVMGKVSKARLEQLSRNLALGSQLDEP